MFISRLKRRWRALIKKKDVEQHLDDELRYHIERDTARNIQSGMSAEDARYAALRSFGNFDQSKEECRDAWGVRQIENLIQDLRFSTRLLVKSPTFAFLAILTLALGIGANTAIFSLLDAVMLRSLPAKNPEELVLFGKAQSGGLNNGFPNESWDLFSFPFYEIVRQRRDLFQDVGSFLSMTWNVHGKTSDSSEPKKLEVQLVSGSYFPLLGLNAHLGRLIGNDDDRTVGQHPVTVVSYAWWQRELGGDPNVVGKTITIDQTTYTIIGVAPKSFISTTVGQGTDLWIPLAMSPQLPPAHWNGRTDKLFQDLYLIGRLNNGVSIQQANATINVLFKQFLQNVAGSQPSAERLQDIERASIELTPAGRGLGGIRGKFALPLKILMAIVGVVLLISCANVANLLLARGAARQKEFGVRIALGSSRMRLVRQMLTESLLLATIGGIAAVLLAWWASRMLLVMASDQADSLPIDVSLNARVLGFALLASLLSAVIFGVAPAFRTTKIDLNRGLKDGKGPVNATSQSKLAKSFVVAQVALSLLLMVAAGLFVRTLINLQSISTGFDQQNVTIFMVDSAATGFKPDRYPPMFRELEEKVKALPGVQADSFSFFIFNQGGWSSPIFTRDPTPPQGEARVVNQNIIGPDFFTTMGVPVLSGRAFTHNDTNKTQSVVVVSEAFERKFFPGSSAVGKRFGDDEKNTAKYEIVGVVKDVKYHNLTETPKPMVYYTHAQGTGALENFAVKFSGSPSSLIPEIRKVIKSVNSNVPVDEVVTLSDHIGRSLVYQKLISRLALFFGLLALLVACLGLYGVLSYSVTQRTSEIGVRLALGASTFTVLRLILKDGMKLTLIGVFLGIAGAYGLTRLVETLLYEVKPVDPTTFIAVPGLLILVALIACYIPARRAARVDPLIALRSE
ncbi:MAG: permease [Blastocatellia bacterium]|nr:MAG: permease [Blastocatellia bacterium]